VIALRLFCGHYPARKQEEARARDLVEKGARTFTTAGQSLMMFVPDEVWVVANYKETQLASQAVAWVGQTLQRQIDLLADIDVFWLLMVVGAIMIPVALILKPVDLGAPAKGH
jgi:hypothetical protein